MIKKILKEDNIPFPNIKGEMEEIERAVQDLNRYHQFDVSVREMREAFEESEPIPLYPEIWNKLYNPNTIIIFSFHRFL